MEISETPVDEFLATLEGQIGDDMRTLDAVITAELPGEPRDLYVGKFWGGSDQQIIGYGRFSYERADKKPVEWFLVGLARQKSYYSVYVSAVEGSEYLAEKYGKTLGKVKVGKSNISFSSVGDIDLEKLAELVAKALAVT